MVDAKANFGELKGKVADKKAVFDSWDKDHDGTIS